MNSTSRAPSAGARSTPRSSARYSATLLVATPIRSASSSSDLAVGRRDDHADRRRAGVAPGATVDVDDHLGDGLRVRGAQSFASSGSSPVTRGRRRSLTSRIPPPELPVSRRLALRRSTITVTCGSSA